MHPSEFLALSTNDRCFSILEVIAKLGGEITPKWDARYGFVYEGFEAEETASAFGKHIRQLTQADYVEKKFFDRISRCPSCSSHQLNLREVCASCGSANLVSVPLLHHFRCGYVAAADSFQSNPDGARICPKCNGTLSHLGVDHDIPGDHFQCLSCSASSQEPAVRALCFGCGKETPAHELLSEALYSFKLTTVGRAALHRGNLFEGDSIEMLYDGTEGLFKRQVILSFLREEEKRLQRYKLPYSVLMLKVQAADKLERARLWLTLLEKLRATLRGVDQLGRYTDDILLISLPQTGAEEALRVQAMVADMANTLPEVRLLCTRVEMNPALSLEDNLTQTETVLSKSISHPTHGTL